MPDSTIHPPLANRDPEAAEKAAGRVRSALQISTGSTVGTPEGAFAPHEDRILVEPWEEPDVTEGGIIRVAKDRPSRGTVLATGPGAWQYGVFVRPRVSAGDQVLFGRHAGQLVELGGKRYLVLRPADLIGTLS